MTCARQVGTLYHIGAAACVIKLQTKALRYSAQPALRPPGAGRRLSFPGVESTAREGAGVRMRCPENRRPGVQCRQYFWPGFFFARLAPCLRRAGQPPWQGLKTKSSAHVLVPQGFE